MEGPEFEEVMNNRSVRSKKHGIIENEADDKENLKRAIPGVKKGNRGTKPKELDDFLMDSDDSDEERVQKAKIKPKKAKMARKKPTKKELKKVKPNNEVGDEDYVPSDEEENEV